MSSYLGICHLTSFLRGRGKRRTSVTGILLSIFESYRYKHVLHRILCKQLYKFRKAYRVRSSKRLRLAIPIIKAELDIADEVWQRFKNRMLKSNRVPLKRARNWFIERFVQMTPSGFTVQYDELSKELSWELNNLCRVKGITINPASPGQSIFIAKNFSSDCPS